MKNLIGRGIFLAVTTILVIFYPKETIAFFDEAIWGVHIYQVLWLILILILLRMLVPRLSTQAIGAKKAFSPVAECADKAKLDKLVAESNRRALRAAFFWILLVAIVGTLYFSGIIGVMGLYLASVFFIFMDSFCVHVWCPFRNWIIGNKCCNSCRIYRWGALMALLPLIFIPSFWTYSVLALALVVFLQWEYMFTKYPERFFEQTNPMLSCKTCPKECPNCKLNIGNK